MADATDTLRRALALSLPAPRSAMLAYDADPFAEREGRTPLRRGYRLDKSKARFVPGPAPSQPQPASSQPRKAPTMATDTTTTPDAAIVSKLKNYLESILTPEQAKDVQAILDGQDVQTPAVMAGDRARLATDTSKRMDGMFPDNNRLRTGFR